jgi:hypothetical protein
LRIADCGLGIGEEAKDEFTAETQIRKEKRTRAKAA